MVAIRENQVFWVVKLFIGKKNFRFANFIGFVKEV